MGTTQHDSRITECGLKIGRASNVDEYDQLRTRTANTPDGNQVGFGTCSVVQRFAECMMFVTHLRSRSNGNILTSKFRLQRKLFICDRMRPSQFRCALREC